MLNTATITKSMINKVRLLTLNNIDSFLMFVIFIKNKYLVTTAAVFISHQELSKIGGSLTMKQCPEPKVQ